MGAPLTLARAAGAVVAPQSLCPVAQARGAAPVSCLAVGAAQSPADQALDVLDYGKRQEGPTYPQSHADGVGVVGPRQRSVGHWSPIPNCLTWELSPTEPVCSLHRYCDQDRPI